MNLTDILTTWVETRGVQQPAFRLGGRGSDNGTEFVNHHLLRYGKATEIRLTRGRPCKKDHTAHIEQKNWVEDPLARPRAVAATIRVLEST